MDRLSDIIWIFKNSLALCFVCAIQVTQLNQKLSTVTKELKEEKELNKHLQKDQQKWHEMVKKLETDFEKYKKEAEQETAELKEQVRDLMFFLQAQDKIEGLDESLREEVAEGEVTVGPSTSKTKRRSKRK